MLRPFLTASDKVIDSKATNRLALVTASILLFGLFLFPNSAFAGKRYAVATGDWNATSTWSEWSGGTSGASVPGVNDTVYISENPVTFTVTIPASYSAVCAAVFLGNSTHNWSATLTFAASSSSLSVANDVIVYGPSMTNTTRTIDVNAGMMTVNGNLSLSDGVTGSQGAKLSRIYVTTGTVTVTGNIIFNALNAAQSTIDMSAGAGRLNLAGNFVLVNAVGTLTPGTTSTINFNGTAAQTIPTGSGMKYNNIYTNNTAGVSLTAPITTTTLTGDIRVQSGVFNNGSYAITGLAGKTFEVANEATFITSAAAGMVSGFGTKIFGATSTVEYAGANQTVTNETYGHLTLSGSGTKTMPAAAMTLSGNFNTTGTITATAGAAITINGNVTLGSGTTFGAGTFTHNVSGNWTNNGATFAESTSTIALNGTADQTLGGTVSTLLWNNVIVNKTTGKVILTTNLTVNATLTFIKGIIQTGNSVVILGASGTVSGAAQATGWVNGNLRKNVTTGTNIARTFEIGDANYYSPLTITFASVTTTGALQAQSIAANHPNIATSDFYKNIPRYWSLTNSGIVFTTYTLSLNWNSLENYSDLTSSLLKIANYQTSTWSVPAVTGTPTTTNVQANGINTFGDFIAGEKCNIAAAISQIPSANLIGNYKLNGNASDETGNNNGTLQNAPTQTSDRFAIANKAYSFNGTSQYVSTTNSYVNPGNFTISTWFKTTTTSGGALIGFGSTQTGGSPFYDREVYMSNTGQIYFHVYNTTNHYLNTTSSFNDGNWHLVTASLSSTTGTKLYLDGVEVASNPAVTTAQNYTGFWKIGFNTLTGVTGVPSSFYFNGALDDVLIYQRALSSSEVTAVYNSPDGAGNNGPICGSANLNLTATSVSGATYLWSGPNGFSSSSQNPVILNANVYSGVYSVQVTNTGCTTTAYTNVVATTTGFSYAGSPYAPNGTANITLSGGATAGTFTATPAGLSLNSSTGAVNLSASTMGTYTVTNTVSGNCSSSSNATITINSNYHYRSITSGNWNATGTWEMSLNRGTSWVSATVAPSTTTDTVTISSGHTVAVTANINPKLLTIAANAVLNPDASVYISGTGKLDGSGTAKVTMPPTGFSTQYSISTKDLSALTVDFAATSAQGVSALTYYNVIISNTSGEVAAHGNFNVTGTLTVNANAVLNGSTYTVGGSGTLTGSGKVKVLATGNASGDFSTQFPITNKTLTNLTIEYAGNALQYINGLTYGSLTLNNAAGANLSAATTIDNSLSLSNGRLELGSYHLTLGATCSVIGTPSASNMIVPTGTGEVRKNYTSIGSFTFPIGDNTGTAEYSPITINYTAGTFNSGAYISMRLVNAKHPNNNSPANYLNRYWIFRLSGITGGSYAVTCNYTDGDIVGNESLIYGGRCRTWTTPMWNLLSGINTSINQFSNSGAGDVGDFTGSDRSCGVYRYRSLITGNWTSSSSWEYSQDGGANWFAAGTFPATEFDTVTVLNGHTITGNLNITPKIFTINTGGVYSPSSGITVSGTGTLNGGGTIKVTKTTATADLNTQYSITNKDITNLTIDYAGTGNQTINALTYNSLSISGSGTKTAGGNLVVNNTLDVSSGVTMDMETNTLTGTLSAIAGTGIIKTQNTSATPIPSAKTWTGDVFYNSSSAQTIVPGNYNNLNGTGGNRTFLSGTTGIGGTFTVGTGVYTVTGSTVDFNGTTSQTIPAFTFNNVTFSGGNTKTCAGNLIVNDALTLGANTTLALSSNNVTLKSTATGTARVATVPTTASITYGTGRFIVERYIPGRRKYRLITSSVTTHANTTLTAGQESYSIWGNWQTNGNNTAGLGNIITGGTSADGFDQQTTNASVYTYDDVNRKYVGFTTANGKNTKYTPLKAGVPYYMFVYGDRTNSIITSTPGNTTISSTGTILTGDQTYNNSSALPLSDVTGRYTMIGNPFASPINWGSVVKTNIASTYWGWDPNLSSTGGYVTVNSTGTVTLISPYSGTTGLNQYIQPGQGFFVQTTAASPQLVIREQDKVSNFNANAFRTRGANDVPLIAVNLLYDGAGNKVLADGVLAAFDSSFSNSLGKEDAFKMSNSAENISIATENNFLSIDARKIPQTKDTIFLNVARLTRPKYTLQVFVNQMENEASPYLEDTYLGTSKPLSITDTNRIDFDIDVAKAASFVANRFRIVFREKQVSPVTTIRINASLKDKDALIEWNMKEDNSVQKYIIEHSADNVTFIKKADIAAKGISGTQAYTWLDAGISMGNNYYRIKSIHTNGTNILSKSALVKLDLPAGGIKVYPNPVRNQLINLQLNNLEKGEYKMQLFSSNGNEVANKLINHTGGSSVHQVQIANKLANGVYYLRMKSNTSAYSQPIFVQQ